MDRRRSTGYWAFLADPRHYRITEALDDLRKTPGEGSSLLKWTTKGKPVRRGDRALIWKGKGRDAWCGVVAFAEVMGAPQRQSNVDDPYWLDPHSGLVVEERVPLRLVFPPHLPLRADESSTASQLSVARARGGTVFYIQRDEWTRLVDEAGGWPVE